MENKIKLARMEAGISRATASRILGIPIRTLENWEYGINKPSSFTEKSVIKTLREIGENREKSYYWAASAYFGGDSPITLLFGKREDRDDYVKAHDLCEKKGKIESHDVYDISGQHFGVIVEKKNGKFIDVESGEEL